MLTAAPARHLVAFCEQVRSRAGGGPDPEAAMHDTTITMYTTAWCGDCRAAKRALEAAGLAFREVDVECDAEALARLEALNDGRRSVPTLHVGDVSASLSRFSPAKLEAFLRAAGLR